MIKTESGTIYKFTIPFDLGVGYCKLIDFYDISMYYGITLKIFDCFEPNITNVQALKGMPLLMNPIPVVKYPSIKGKYAWKKLGVLREDSDLEIPIYKDYVNNGFAWDTLEEYEKRDWNALIDLKSKIGPLSFNKVRHLEELFWRSTVTIAERVAMQILRYKKINVVDFFTKNSTGDSWKVDYNTQQFIPLYRNIPEAIKGKPLIKGFVPDEYLDFNWNNLED